MTELRIYYLAERAVRDELTVEEARELDVWLSASPNNKAEFTELTSWIDASDALFDGVQPHTDQEWTKLQAKLAAQNSSVTRPLRPPFWARTRAWAVAAAIALIAVVGYFALNNKGDAQGSQLHFTADANGVATHYFADGSYAILNGGSELVANAGFGTEHRRSSLKGEAYFKVAKDPSKPFVVSAGQTTVEVLGTQFNVRRSGNGHVQLSVEEGRVRFSEGNPQQALILVAGEVAEYDPQTGRIEKQATSAKDQIGWTVGRLVFKDTPFPQAAEQLERYYRVSLHFPERLKAARLNATFDKMPLEAVMDVLKTLYNVKVSQDGKVVTLSE